MAIRRMTEVGCLALVCGMVLVGSALLATPSVSREEIARTFGGDCQECKAVKGCRSSDCEDIDEGSKKITGTNQGTATCKASKSGVKECEPDAPKPCTTTTSCDGPGCTINCSDEATPTNTNCKTAGVCVASP